MNKFNFKLIKWLFPVMFFGMLGLVACDPDEENLEPMRMFMPAGVINSTSSVNQVRLSWRTPVNTVESNTTYTVEVATDTLFTTPVVLTAQTDSSGIVFTDEQLQVQQRYFARVKANAFGDRPESKWLYSSRFMIRGEQILLTPNAFDITNNAAIIRWRAYPGLTRLVLTPLVEGGTPIQVQLTDADRSANMKTVTGLQPSTSYRVQIFQNNIMRGFMTIRTISGIAGTTINLSGNTDPGALMEAIANAPSGSTILLAKGATYNISSTVNLDKSLRIMSEISTNPNRATIFFTSNFNVAAGSQIDSVVFRDVVMRSDNYTSRYVMNINTTSTVRRIKFEGTHAEIFRGLVRLQAAVTVDRFSVINSVVDSLSNYGVLAIDNTGASVQDIVFSNSTFYKIERPIFSRTNSRSILIENSTFNEVPEGGRFIVDYGSLNVTNGVQVRNSIIGIGKAIGTNRAGSGIRVGTATLVESSGTYSTADRQVASHPIPGIIQYNRTSFDLFQNPKAGNFTLKDNTFLGRNTAGDPRWRL